MADVAPHLYSWVYYDGDNHILNGDWPGEIMTQTHTTADGNTWWTQRIHSDQPTINIIFNAGSSRNQTSDINGLPPGNHYFIYDGDSTFQDITEQYK